MKVSRFHELIQKQHPRFKDLISQNLFFSESLKINAAL